MDHEQGVLPGFRFHPTDEELLSFYLRRKIEKKLIRIEFIKQMDIYKYDPWDLPKNSSVTDKEWYFFCKRGRKYKNSIRPNRVTGSGFWKATGIDKPIYSVQGQGCHGCIGLKKSLVYYRGSAGKGTKTDWMMHEFRLPADRKNTSTPLNAIVNANTADEEVEIWTLCRIFKRDLSERRSKYTPKWGEICAKRKPTNSRPEAAAAGNMDSGINRESYIWFGAPEEAVDHNEKKPYVVGGNNYNMNGRKELHHVVSEPESTCSSTVLTDEAMEFFAHSNWDEIVSAIDYALFDDPCHF